MILPDRNPDGFDHFRRSYIASGLSAAARAMPDKMRRQFVRYLEQLSRGEAPVDPPEPPRNRRPRRKKAKAQYSLLSRIGTKGAA